VPSHFRTCSFRPQSSSIDLRSRYVTVLTAFCDEQGINLHCERLVVLTALQADFKTNLSPAFTPVALSWWGILHPPRTQIPLRLLHNYYVNRVLKETVFRCPSRVPKNQMLTGQFLFFPVFPFFLFLKYNRKPLVFIVATVVSWNHTSNASNAKVSPPPPPPPPPLLIFRPRLRYSNSTPLSASGRTRFFLPKSENQYVMFSFHFT
jgi:hypothetical protein